MNRVEQQAMVMTAVHFLFRVLVVMASSIIDEETTTFAFNIMREDIEGPWFECEIKYLGNRLHREPRCDRSYK